MKVDWIFIFTFILMVLGLSYLFQQDFILSVFHGITKSSMFAEFEYLVLGLSTLISASILLSIHKGISQRITVLGKEKAKNILISLLPIVAFSISGLQNEFGINVWLYGFLYSIINTIYAFAEELAWRKYLQNALEGLNKNLKYILIGIIWWVWHFRFETQFDFYIFPLLCIGGGFFLGKLADDTNSIMPVIAMHSVIILTTNSGRFGINEVLGIMLVIIGWFAIEQVWKKNRQLPSNIKGIKKP